MMGRRRGSSFCVESLFVSCRLGEVGLWLGEGLVGVLVLSARADAQREGQRRRRTDRS